MLQEQATQKNENVDVVNGDVVSTEAAPEVFSGDVVDAHVDVDVVSQMDDITSNTGLVPSSTFGEDGVYVDDQGNYVDVHGNSVLMDGGYLDENGEFIAYDNSAAEADAAADAALEAMHAVVALQDSLAELRDGFESDLISYHRDIDSRRGQELSKRQSLIDRVKG